MHYNLLVSARKYLIKKNNHAIFFLNVCLRKIAVEYFGIPSIFLCLWILYSNIGEAPSGGRWGSVHELYSWDSGLPLRENFDGLSLTEAKIFAFEICLEYCTNFKEENNQFWLGLYILCWFQQDFEFPWYLEKTWGSWYASK